MQIILFIIGIIVTYLLFALMFAISRGTTLNSRIGCLWVEISIIVIGTCLFLIPVLLFWQPIVPYHIDGYWFGRGSLLNILGQIWPIFVWSGLLFLVTLRLFGLNLGIIVETDPISGQKRTLPQEHLFPPSTAFSLSIGFWQIVWIGLGEEIFLRWLALPGVIVVLNGLNFLLNGLLDWLYQHILVFILNGITFGSFQTVLFQSGWGWVVGTAIMVASLGSFRRRYFPIFYHHLIFWPVEVYLFLIMFQYGLVASMLVHVLLEVLLFVLAILVTPYVRLKIVGMSETLYPDWQPRPRD